MLHKHNIAGGIWFIEEEFVQNYLPLVTGFLQGNILQSKQNKKDIDETLSAGISVIGSTFTVSEYGWRNNPDLAPENSIAIIEIQDVITKYDQDCGPAGMNTKANLLSRCFQNSNISAVVLKIDSGGGEAYAMFQMAEAIAKKNKPVYAFVEDMACSAAYGIAAACDSVYANMELAKVGSIGAYSTLLDYRQHYEQRGVKVHEIYASQSKDKNIEFKEAIKGNYEPLRKMIDTLTDKFINDVQSNRNDKLTDKQSWATGKTMYAKDAIAIGLIDKICQFEDMISEIETTIQNNNIQQMKKQPVNVNAVLGVEELASTSEGVFLNEEQVHTIDTELANRESQIETERANATAATAAQQQAETNLTAAKAQIAKKDDEIAALNAQIDNLKAGKGASTKAHVKESDTQGAPEEDDQFESFSAAQDLYKILP